MPIRPLVICLFRHKNHILVMEGYDPVKQQTFYRPLGGGIEFGEHSAIALRRELREELGAEITTPRYLGTLENIYTYANRPGHEIVLVYDAAFVDPSFYVPPRVQGVEDNGKPFYAHWKSLDFFRAPGAPPLYPTGLLDLMRTQSAPPTINRQPPTDYHP